MERIIINIKRSKSLVGAAMPYKILINNEEIVKLRNGKSFSCEIPCEQCTLKVLMCGLGNSFTFHKMEKEIVLFPRHCNMGTINCSIKTIPNWFGIMSMGIFQPIGKVELSIEYF